MSKENDVHYAISILLEKLEEVDRNLEYGHFLEEQQKEFQKEKELIQSSINTLRSFVK